MRLFSGLLAVLQLAVLLPANLYFGVTGHPWSLAFAAVNLVFGWVALYGAADPYRY